MRKKLLALFLLFLLLPGAAAAVPVQPDQAAVSPLDGGKLDFWNTAGADAWARKELELFPGAGDVLTVIAAQQGIAADCLILQCGGQTALIDCGRLGPNDLVPRLLEQLGVGRIDYIINTHPHDDHINGIFELLQRYPIGRIYVGFERHYRNLNKRLFREAEALDIPVEQLTPPVTLRLGTAELMVYQVPWGDNTNNRSLVTRVTLGERSILLTADIGQSGILWLFQTYGEDAFQADILKIPHHGIDPIVPELLKAAEPQAVFITYYPHKNTAEMEKKLNALGYEPIYTGYNTLVMKTDGEVWTVTQLPKEEK